MKPIIIVVASLCLMSGWRTESTRAQGTLLAYEPFDYAVGSDLIGRAGGTGFTGSWRGTILMTNYDVGSGSLPFAPLPALGQHVRMASQITPTLLWREIATHMGAAGTTRYVSVLLRPEGVLHLGCSPDFFGVFLPGLPGGKSLFIGKPGAAAGTRGSRNYALETLGTSQVGQFPSSQAPAIGQTVLLVVKAEFTAGLDRFTLYVNPAVGGPEPAGGTVKQDIDLGPAVNRIAIYAAGEFAIDELRIGERFADVTPKSVAGHHGQQLR